MIGEWLVEGWGDEMEGGVDKGLPLQPDTTRWGNKE
jgi:hypothetical protein